MLLVLFGCDRSEPSLAGCGDGVLDADEACDDGADNSDTTADACRSSCALPSCGDGAVDGGEACDDGARWGGDGCDPDCVEESGTLEAEPNDTWDVATAAGAVVHGSLLEEDADCWSFAVERCGAVTVAETAPCARTLTLSLHDPSGALVATGAPDAEGCATLDPADQPGARWVGEGDWAACATPIGGEVHGYTLAISAGSAEGLDAAGDDLDGDGEPDSCDTDTDGDGVEDDDDDCPDVSDGPSSPAPTLSADGFVRHWLGAGPFAGGTSTGDCRPSEDAFVGEDVGFAPSLGDDAGGRTWIAWLPDSDRFDMLTFATIDPAREAYALVYLQSDSARTLTLAVGADDGVFAWWNGEKVMDVSGCQGVTADQFTATVEVAAGWNTLLFKVRDQGGEWGVAARFYDVDGALVTDLEPSIVPGESWVPGQSDLDGDGVGDLCDSTP